MSRTKKDRPYAVKLNELRAAGKTRRLSRVIGYTGRPVPSLNRRLSAVFLKGDVEGIKAHRASLAGMDVQVTETEHRMTVAELCCHAEEPHEHNGELYQLGRYLGAGNDSIIANDLFPLFSRIRNTHPGCCFPYKRRTRAVVQFIVHSFWTPTATVYESEDYDANLIGWSTPSKSRHRESAQRAKTRTALVTLRRSPDAADVWDAGTAMDEPRGHDC